MNYYSTRNKSVLKTSAQAIYQGLSAEGGLFVPTEIPSISPDELESFIGLPYSVLAEKVLSKFLTDFTEGEIHSCVTAAYGNQFFDERIAPTVTLDKSLSVLELWHGPTCAFKDMALQLLPHLLVKSKEKQINDDTIMILVATSGDTGKAALEGFKDVDGTKIMVFYPENGVSHMQKLQMQTQEGKNVAVCAIKGNFDDAQSGVKAIFADASYSEKVKEHGCIFSSANSINWGRLVPQIVYYFGTYAQLREKKTIDKDEQIDVCVPTGNFGDILAAYYAREMGLPIGKLVCASNKNNILTDFINTGVYDRNRDFFMTSSPSMDILISSNLERLIFHMSGGDDTYVRSCFDKLASEGRYEVSDRILRSIQNIFSAGWTDEEQTLKTISSIFKKYNYLIDTHTATAMHVAKKYMEETENPRHMVVVSTASPYKFADHVLEALGGTRQTDDFAVLKALSEKTGTSIPKPLASLIDKEVRFTDTAEKNEMKKVVSAFLD